MLTKRHTGLPGFAVSGDGVFPFAQNDAIFRENP